MITIPREKQISDNRLIPIPIPVITEAVARAVIAHIMMTWLAVLTAMSGFRKFNPGKVVLCCFVAITVLNL